ncbi:MAG: DNA-3-methyladenine glycosylase, partial [Clostridium sp.]
MKLQKDFYKQDALSLSKALLGKILVRKVNGKVLKGKIVETECYIGKIDKACHAYPNKVTERIKPLYEDGGIAYVYFIYGKYFCFNVIAGEEGSAEGVLIRALEPLNELEYLCIKRFNKSINEIKEKDIKGISNGPSKLCLAYDITKEQNYNNLYKSKELYIEEGDYEELEIVETTRIGIDYAEEARFFPWRFYIK